MERKSVLVAVDLDDAAEHLGVPAWKAHRGDAVVVTPQSMHGVRGWSLGAMTFTRRAALYLSAEQVQAIRMEMMPGLI